MDELLSIMNRGAHEVPTMLEKDRQRLEESEEYSGFAVLLPRLGVMNAVESESLSGNGLKQILRGGGTSS